MTLRNQAKDIAKYIEKNKSYTNRNAQLFDIYEGNLKPYVEEILRSTLSENYYSKIKERIFPINILKRVIDKSSQAYKYNPQRTATGNKEVLEFYEKKLGFNKKMNVADEFSNMFRGYALEPYVDEGLPKLRVLPYDRFLVMGTDFKDPTKMTHFLKYVGKMENDRGKEVDVWFVYTNEEFMAIDNEGRIIEEFMEENEGINPYGCIPIFYGNRSEYDVLPTQDTDTLELAKLMPVMITDLAGAIMFQCFSIIYGIDVDSENMTMSPNAFWSMKSDPASEKTPSVGTIKPEADIEKVLSFIKETFATWLETRGIRIGNLSNTSGQSFASGISKIIDEMDTQEAIKKSIEKFKDEEFRFWSKMGKIHNYWVESKEITGLPQVSKDWLVLTEFDDPKPLLDRTEEVDLAIKEVDNKLISRERAQKRLYDWDDKQIKKENEQIEKENEFVMGDQLSNGEVATDKNSDKEEI